MFVFYLYLVISYKLSTLKKVIFFYSLEKLNHQSRRIAIGINYFAAVVAAPARRRQTSIAADSAVALVVAYFHELLSAR